MLGKLTLFRYQTAIIICLCLPLPHVLEAFASPQHSFRVATDFSQFRHRDQQNYLELYYSYNESSLTYVKQEGRYEGAVLMHVLISSTLDDSVEMNRKFRIPHLVQDTTNLASGKSLAGVIRMIISNDSHRLALETFDDHDKSRSHLVVYELPEKSFEREEIAISDVELSSSIKTAGKDRNSIFYKNSLEIIPNPSRIYGSQLPVLYFYVEAYNLLTEAQNGMYQTRATIFNSEGLEIMTHKTSKQRINESSVEVGQLKVGLLPSGVYRFEFSLTDSAADLTVRSQKKFKVFNPDITPRETPTSVAYDLLNIEYDTNSEEQLDEEFSTLSYIAQRNEVSVYRKLSSFDEKKEFLIEFWQRRDSDPQTPLNEMRSEYLVRVQYANSHFASGFKKGWDTDRGRVFIIYGPPDEYVRNPSEIGTKPYELWYYHNIQGGVMFVFADLSGFQDYRLTHSTHPEEMKDYNWMEQVRRN